MGAPNVVTDVTPDTLASQLSHWSQGLRKWNSLNYMHVLRTAPYMPGDSFQKRVKVGRISGTCRDPICTFTRWTQTTSEAAGPGD